MYFQIRFTLSKYESAFGAVVNLARQPSWSERVLAEMQKEYLRTLSLFQCGGNLQNVCMILCIRWEIFQNKTVKQ